MPYIEIIFIWKKINSIKTSLQKLDELNIKKKQFCWPVHNTYKHMITPVVPEGLEKLRVQQSLSLRTIVDAPRYVRNATIQRDLRI